MFYCMKCTNKAINGSRLCIHCYNAQMDYLKSKARDIETYDEDRVLFLLRKSKELGLNHTKKKINTMIWAGMTDFLILKTESENVWAYRNEASKALPVHIRDNSL